MAVSPASVTAALPSAGRQTGTMLGLRAIGWRARGPAGNASLAGPAGTIPSGNGQRLFTATLPLLTGRVLPQLWRNP